VVALADGGRLHAEHVGAGGGLAHAHPADRRSGARIGKPARALCVAAVLVQVVGEEHRVREVGEAEAGIRRGQLLVRDHGRDGVHARSAEALRHRDPEQSELAEPAEERAIERLRAVGFRRLRLDLARREVPHHRTQRGVLGRGREEIGHGRPSTRGSPPRRIAAD
jgi:hypothetical protein